MANPLELTDEQIASAFEKMKRDDEIHFEIDAMKKQISLLTEMVITLSHDLNGRLQRRKNGEQGVSSTSGGNKPPKNSVPASKGVPLSKPNA